MKTYLIVDEKEKRKMGIICFLPSFLFFICLVYYLILLFPLTQGYHPIYSAERITVLHYNTLFIMLATAACVAASVLIYCIVHLVKIKMLNTQQKMLWLLVLVTFVPVSFILFWFLQVKKEPKYMPVYPDIA